MYFTNFIDFKYQYSWIFIPLLFILYILLPKLRVYLLYPQLCIGLIGIIATIYPLLGKSKREDFKSQFKYIIINIIGHLPAFIGLLYGFKYFKINYITLLTYIIGIIFIYYIPFWPYIPSRDFFAILLTLLTILYMVVAILINLKL
tara:strand:- start:119 stop:556 length:438 start_codon:yes stop_codon:yes gene_type:complete